jgi:threonine/homoserine/homoserine lactone efflux protein
MLLWLPTRHLAAFLLTMYVLIAVPGPSVVFVVTRGVVLGRRAAMATVLGNAAGLTAQLILVALGVGGLIVRSATALEVVTLVGAGYLVLLGVRGVLGRRGGAPSAAVRSLETPQARTSPAANARQGFVVGLTNPKGLIMFIAFLPRFVDRTAGHATAQLLALGAICVALALASDGTWAVAAGSAGRWLGRSPRPLERLRLGGGLTLIALGIGLAVAGVTGGA